MPSTLESLSDPAAADAATSSSAAADVMIGKKRRRGSSCIASSDSDSDYIEPNNSDGCSSSDDDDDYYYQKKPIADAAIGSAKPQAKSASVAHDATSSVVAPMETECPRPRKGQQQWTELTAVHHVFCDQVYKYMNPIGSSGDGELGSSAASSSSSRKQKTPPHLSMGEKRQLELLIERVKERVDEQSGGVLENRRLVKEAKHATKRVKHLRNDIMITRLLARKMEGEVAALERQLRQRKRDGEKMRKAGRFLSAVETLAKRSSVTAAPVMAKEAVELNEDTRVEES